MATCRKSWNIEVEISIKERQLETEDCLDRDSDKSDSKSGNDAKKKYIHYFLYFLGNMVN